ncbi:MAG: MerR family transcriptional regulator [Methylophaga sp.]|uniref:MerR family transcriptional regulator n=1 Tax=Methylophaga sp. UBA678 TaxID=1946901 RepID=UPI000C5F09DC|nr:MerR family transcriptional regulator [Methylophaga sp. UBA678]MAX50948.1 MerR family transcriptional regulator [Methylophaga sp.]|tara:strand:- start:146647 stop:147042 length:396 start_codon:yes stop_codon:yes gene_type:complete
MKKDSWTIGQFAKQVNVTVETVRYYQRKGLLDTPDSAGGIRRYGQHDLRRLKFIRKAQEAGFTLREIKELIGLDSTQDHHRAYQLAMRRLQELDAKIADMQQARDSLKRLAGNCAVGGESKPCAILAAFNV